MTETAEIVSWRSSSASWRSWSAFSRRMSAGMSTVSRSGVVLCPVMESLILPRSALHARRATTNFAACLSRSAASPNGSRCAAACRASSSAWARARSMPRIDTKVALPAAASLPGVLPSSGGGALDVEQVVDDLEGEAEIVGIGRQRRAHGLARLAQDRAGRAGEGDQRAGLQPLQAGDGADRQVGACVSASRSSIWPPTMPCAPAALASSRDQRRRARPDRRACPRAPAPRRPAPAARRRPGWPSPRRTACDRRACRGGDRRRPSPADRRGSANRRARIRWRWRSAAPTTRATLNSVAPASTKNGAQPLAAAQARIAHGLEDARLAARRRCGSRRSMVRSTDWAAKRQRGLELAIRRQRHGRRRTSSRSAGWLPTEPSAEKTIFSTFILASASFCSQCRFSSAPRS